MQKFNYAGCIMSILTSNVVYGYTKQTTIYTKIFLPLTRELKKMSVAKDDMKYVFYTNFRRTIRFSNCFCVKQAF